jgi:hypothetical protein
LQIICLGWPRTGILLISASWVARITHVSHCTQLCAVFLVVVPGTSHKYVRAHSRQVSISHQFAYRPLHLAAFSHL